MTPDLDQSLSLKAQLVDDVTPQLEKIDKATKTTQDAVNQMAEASAEAGKKMGSSTTGMADSTDQASRKMKDSLGDAGSAFKDFGSAAQEGSKQAGEALKDALYTGQTSSRLNQLEKDLGDLNKTMGGMASTQRVTQGRARNLRAISQDSINKKLIPAFQELHSTLDDYPDTLSKINKLEQDRMDTLDAGGGGALEGVRNRVGKIGAAIDDAKFGAQKAIAAVTATAMGVVALQTEAQQREMGRIGGVAAFEATPELIERSIQASRAPMSEFTGALQALADAAAVSHAEIPGIIGDIVNISKATGIADSDLADLRDKIVSLGSIRGEGFLELTNNMATFAHETRADMTDMVSLFSAAGDEMIKFSGDARKAYQNAVLAGGAAAKQFGIEADAPKNLLENLQSSYDAYAKGYGLIARVSDMSAAEYEKNVSTGNVTDLFGPMMEGLISQTGGAELTLPQIKEAFAAFTPGITEQDYSRALEATQVDPTQPFGEQFQAVVTDILEKAGDGTKNIAETAGSIRRTFTEQVERMVSTLQQGFVFPGVKSLQVVEWAGEMAFNKMAIAADWIVGKDRASGRKISTAVGGAAAVGIGAAAGSSMMGSVIGGLPGGEKISNVVGGGFGKVVIGGLIAAGLMKDPKSPVAQAFGTGTGGIDGGNFDQWRMSRGYIDAEGKPVEGGTAREVVPKSKTAEMSEFLYGNIRKQYMGNLGFDKEAMASDLGNLTGKRYMPESVEGKWKERGFARDNPDVQTEYYKNANDLVGTMMAEQMKAMGYDPTKQITPADAAEEMKKEVASPSGFKTNIEGMGNEFVFSPEEVLAAQKGVPEGIAEEDIAQTQLEKINATIVELKNTPAPESENDKASLAALLRMNEMLKGMMESSKQTAENTKPPQPSTSQAVKPTTPHGVENSEAFLTYEAGR